MRWLGRIFTRKSLSSDADLLALLGSPATASGIQITAESALRVPAVSASVRTISEACASLSCRVVEISEDGTETVDRSHPANALIASESNDWTSSFELIRSLVVDALSRDAGGLAWVNWINGQPTEIIHYQPGIIGVEYDKDGTGEPFYRINGRPTPRQQIVHLRSTFDRSPVSLCREAIAVAMAMEQHAARLFGRGARPSGILSMEGNLNETAVERITSIIAKQHSGENSGATMILPHSAKFSPTTFNSVDSQFQQLRIFQLQEIARAFNIPSVLIGELSRATWSNSAEMQRLFLMLCLEPWLLALEGAFRRTLFLKEDRARFAIRFERDDFSKVDLAVLATAMNSLIASRVINPNTARDWLDLPPYENGDEYANPNTGSSQPGVPSSEPTPDLANSGDEPDIESDEEEAQ